MKVGLGLELRFLESSAYRRLQCLSVPKTSR